MMSKRSRSKRRRWLTEEREERYSGADGVRVQRVNPKWRQGEMRETNMPSRCAGRYAGRQPAVRSYFIDETFSHITTPRNMRRSTKCAAPVCSVGTAACSSFAALKGAVRRPAARLPRVTAEQSTNQQRRQVAVSRADCVLAQEIAGDRQTRAASYQPKRYSRGGSRHHQRRGTPENKLAWQQPKNKQGTARRQC